MKRLIWALVLAVATLLLIVGVISHNKKEPNFYVERTNTLAAWNQKTYVPMDAVVASRLSGVNIQNGDKLSSGQREALIESTLGWMKAYSRGTREDFMRFRFPTGVPWQWKTGAVEKMSNYFVNGMVFSTDATQDAWMRRYGNPDRIKYMAPYVDASKNKSREELDHIRARWVAKYGDGSIARTNPHPADPFEQWATIASEEGMGTWWKNYWTGACLDEMIISISDYTKVPVPLHEYPFGLDHRGKGFDMDASFPNMGFESLSMRSHIEWKFTYESLLNEQASLKTANIYCMFSRDKGYPQPALLRLVYVDKYNQWLPVEFVNANVVMGEGRILWF